ncbi:TetR family transcriptional regulator [Murinocardiopsis flavida]|uniref:TetR family transcriptional regulator n=1 Tax=Murinocardiopsis flavida TaxID=645275 RepID=A0A2P8CJB4_9ACTN|nr:TetR/AcrR family transcriptional regulator [Murinocardiopsis flavida]PSK85032.1 TetR family transcriptional regulator [Murinocardiopsis flavida]
MADPERSTELLWGVGSRRGLSLDSIVRAAVELADAEGLAAVSMRRLADRLGFTTMALYRHIPGKSELLALMCDAVHGENHGGGPAEPGTEDGTGPGTEDGAVPGAGPDGEGGGWRDALAAWAREAMALHRRHAWLAESDDARQVPGPNIVARYDRGLGIVAATGLAPAQVVASVDLVGGFVDSTARQAAAAARAEARSGVSHEEWWGGRDSLYAHLDRYPALTRLYRESAYDAPLDPFEFGLQRVLDGVAALIRDESEDEKGCAVCGAPVESGPAGRPRDYCSRACRQRAYRMRKGRHG